MRPNLSDIKERPWSLCTAADPDLSRTFGLYVLSDIRSVQGVIKVSLEVSASAVGDDGSLANVKETYAAERAELEKSLAASEEKVADVEPRIQKFKPNKNTQHGLETIVEEAEAYWKSPRNMYCSSKIRCPSKASNLVKRMLLRVSTWSVLLFSNMNRQMHRLTLGVLLHSTHAKRMCLMISVPLRPFTSQLHNSVPLLAPKK